MLHSVLRGEVYVCVCERTMERLCFIHRSMRTCGSYKVYIFHVKTVCTVDAVALPTLCWCLAPHLCFHSTHTQSHIYMAYECVRIIITFNFSKVFFSVEMLVVRCCCDDAAKCNCPAIFSVIAAVVHESRVHANCVNFDIVINFPALTTRDCAQDDVFPFPCERENEQESNFEWI